MSQEKKKIIDELLKDAPPGQVKQVLSGKTQTQTQIVRASVSMQGGGDADTGFFAFALVLFCLVLPFLQM